MADRGAMADGGAAVAERGGGGGAPPGPPHPRTDPHLIRAPSPPRRAAAGVTHLICPATLFVHLYTTSLSLSTYLTVHKAARGGMCAIVGTHPCH